MTKLKGILAILLALVIACGALIGCAAPVVEEEEEVAPPPPAQLKPCSVDLTGIYVITGPGLPAFGSGSNDVIVQGALFTISNPNDYMVAVDRFSYKIDVGGGLDVAHQLGTKYWIPADEQITLEGVAVWEWFKLFQGKIGEGYAFGEAVGATVPLWKGMGGKGIDIMYYGNELKVPAETWGEIDADSVVYKWEARIHTSGEGMDEYSHTSGSYSD